MDPDVGVVQRYGWPPHPYPRSSQGNHIGISRRFPLRPPRNVIDKYHLFAELRGSVHNHPWRERVRQVRILPETWRLIDEIIAARQDRVQRSVRSLGVIIKAILQGGRQRRSE